MKALIIVDVQNDFCEGGALAVPHANEIIPKINKITDNYDLVISTQDYHPSNHQSFAVNNGKEIGEIIDLNGIDQFMWPVHCVQGERGSEFHKDVFVGKVFTKGENTEIDSYSGFFDNDGKSETGLREYLQNKGVTEVDVVGLALDYCVKFTALDSSKIGFKTKVLQNMTKAVNVNEKDGEKAILELKEAGVEVV